MRQAKILFFGLLILMLSGTAWAASYDDHVKIAPNNQGDVLIFPFYAAIDGGFETKLTVVNTSRTESTVAKVVMRSEVYSQELLDFLIYLSPSDVWTGTLRWDAQDGVVLFSDDDSILAAPGVFASQDNPVNQPLFAAAGTGDSNLLGYVYVINAATAELNDPQSPGNKVAKPVILDWYQPLTSTDIENIYPPKNILAGFMDFNVRDAFLTSGLNAVTLRDYVNERKLSVAEATRLGEDANNNLLEIEAVLSKLDVSMPYVNTAEDVSLHFFNFPTKYHFDAAIIEQPPLGPFFRQNAVGEDYCVSFGFEAYDLQENRVTDPSPIFSPAPPEDVSRFCRELNWVDSMQFAFEEGFTRYDFMLPVTSGENLDGETLTYLGAPVIPMQLNLGQTGLSMKYGAWTDGVVVGTVEETDVLFFDYHYSDTPNSVEF